MSMTLMFAVPYTYSWCVGRYRRVHDLVHLPSVYCRRRHRPLEGASNRTPPYLEGDLIDQKLPNWLWTHGTWCQYDPSGNLTSVMHAHKRWTWTQESALMISSSVFTDGPGSNSSTREKQHWVSRNVTGLADSEGVPLKILLKGSCCAIRRANFTDSANDRTS